MAEITKVCQLALIPGIKRDGTVLDGDNCSDGQWVRFQRGRPKKMGGYQLITDTFEGPIRKVLLWSRSAMNSMHVFSTSKIQMILVDSNGAGGAPYDRSPAGFTANPDYIWTADTLFNAVGGNTGILAHASVSMPNIDDNTESDVYLGDAAGVAAFTPIAGTGPSGNGVSGGVFCVAPYAFYYGSDGFLQWSDANQPTVLDSGDADSGRITGAKLVCGLPLRSGAGPAGLLWSMDSVIRMDWNGAAPNFKFTHLTTQSSVLSQSAIIEYDGMYLWPGVDRFLYSDGSQVKELPNQMNLNWFFDNLNYAQRQKVWAMKIPRFGEVWWFYPHGDVTECNRAIIYNIREQSWYDTALGRSAGYHSEIFHHPVMANSNPSGKKVITVSAVVGTFAIGDTVEGTLSFATGKISDILGSRYTIQMVSAPGFESGETLNDLQSAATATISSVEDTYGLYVHEKGRDAVEGENVSAIESHFTTCDFGFPTGGATESSIVGANRWTRLTRVEPDFIQEGDMEVYVAGRSAARGTEVVSSPYAFSPETARVDMREHHREIFLKFRSNCQGGHYEMGRTLLWLEPGDLRG